MIRFTAEAAAPFAEATEVTRNDATPVLTFLSAGFEVPWFRERSPRIWSAIVKPSEKLRSHFGLNLEYFLIGHGFTKDFHQSTLLEEPPEKVAYRIDRRIRFVASSAPLAEPSCQAWAQQRKIAIILLKPDTFLSELGDPEAQLYKALSKFLWRRDLFDDSEPIRSSAEFFGREADINEVLAKAIAGTPVAIFGLRKVGKSSLMRRVEDLLLSDESAVSASAFLLCNSTRLKSGRWWHVLSDALQGWRDALDQIAGKLNSKARAKIEKLPLLIEQKRQLDDASAVAHAFESDLNRLLKVAKQLARESDKPSARLVLFMDEADELYPHMADSGYWKQDFFHLWNTLQTSKRRLDDPAILSYVLGGVNPSGVERGSLVDQANPLFEVSRKYLGPMTEEEGGQLLNGLGSRMGLRFAPEAVSEAFNTVGGHPWLLRKMGSAIHHSLKSRSAIQEVSAATTKQVFSRTKREFFAHVHWILDHLRRVAPDEERLLRDLALGGAEKYVADWADQEFRDTFAHHLEQYGLLVFDGDVPQLSLRLIADALKKPVANGIEEQVGIVRREMDLLEENLRTRLVVDIAANRTAEEAVDAIVSAIPKEAANRPKGRDALRQLGLTGGLRSLVEAMNWGDYVVLLEKFHDEIEWQGSDVERKARLAQVAEAVQVGHLARASPKSRWARACRGS
jgi:hypothetical protein